MLRNCRDCAIPVKSAQKVGIDQFQEELTDLKVAHNEEKLKSLELSDDNEMFIPFIQNILEKQSNVVVNGEGIEDIALEIDSISKKFNHHK